MSSGSRILGRLLGRLLLGVLVLLLLLVLLAGMLLGTSPGLEWVIRQTDGVVPGHIEVARVEGGLFGRLRLESIRYQAPEMEVIADELVLRWIPGELLRGRFHLEELSVQSPSYTQLVAPAPEPEEVSSSIQLPDIRLPIDVLADKVEVKSLSYRSPADAEPVQVGRVLLSAMWSASGVDVRTLELEMDGAQFAANGKALPEGAYPLDLHTDLSLALPDVPKTEATGRIHGDLASLDIRQDLRGDIEGVLQATVNQPLKDLRWQAELDLKGFRLQSIAPGNEGRLAGTLSAQGDLARARAEGHLRLEDAPSFYSPWHTELDLAADLGTLAVDLRNLQITRPESAMELRLSGTANADLSFDLQGGWNALQWPPEGTPEYRSGNGELELTGTADDYRLSLAAVLSGTDVPQGDWHLRGKGSTERFEIQQLEGKTLGGRIGATGTFTWAPGLEWNLALEGQDIDPGLQYPEWPGRLDLALSSEGTLVDDKLDVTAVIQNLAGTLRDRSVNSMGKVRLREQEISLETVRLASGSAVVTANGRLGEKSELDWRVDVPDMADLAPEAAGTLHGSGSIRGSMLEPDIGGTLKGENLAFQDLAVASLAADIALDLSDQSSSRVDLQSSGIRVADEEIASASLQAEGRRRDHRLEAHLEHALATLDARLEGGADESMSSWSGKIQTLEILSGDFGDWTLKKPAGIAVSADDLRLDELCLARDAGFLCAAADVVEGAGNATARAAGLELDWLEPYFPLELEELTGSLGLVARAQLGDLPLADVDLTLDPGTIVIHPEASPKVALEHQGGELKAKLDAHQLAASFHFDIGDDGLRGDLLVPRAKLDVAPLDAPIDGDLRLNFRQLPLLTGLVPGIQAQEGKLTAEFAIKGRLGEPSLKGGAELQLARVDIPDAGLELREILVRADSPNGRNVKIDGGVTSGKGRLRLDGDIELDADKHWPLRLTVRGENFQALNLPDKNVLISSDVVFEHAADGMLLTGTLTIPKALIVVDEIPEGAVQTSPDVVVETGSKPPSKGAPFAMKLAVIAGKNVEFRGFGLQAYLQGRLAVSQNPGAFPTADGEIRTREGSFKAYGQELIIEQGILAYSGGRIDNPGLIVRASREAEVNLSGEKTDVKVGVDVSGTARRPDISVFSIPAMEQRDAMSVLLTGNTSEGLREGGGSIGIDRQLTDKLSVGAAYDRSSAQTEIVTKYKINRKLHVEATTGAASSAGDIFYSLEFD